MSKGPILEKIYDDMSDERKQRIESLTDKLEEQIMTPEDNVISEEAMDNSDAVEAALMEGSEEADANLDVPSKQEMMGMLNGFNSKRRNRGAGITRALPNKTKAKAKRKAQRNARKAQR